MSKKNKTYNIAIGCIGSGVGQSIINSCRLSQLPFKTIGLGMNPLAYGLYDCDVADFVPSIYERDYVNALIEKCKKHKVDLLIPGHDDEALIISQSIGKFNRENIEVIVSKKELHELCRDKERLTNELNKITPIFVKSYNKNSAEEALRNKQIKCPLISKPRDGHASRGIVVINSMSDLEAADESNIFQELILPTSCDPNFKFLKDQIEEKINPQVSEISIQLVTDKNGILVGRMASYNKLCNGIPIEIILIENTHIWDNIDKIYPKLKEMGLRGPLNLQGRITNNGLKLFEMNPRFTGITGLRALMGFNEVEFCIKNWLNLDEERYSLKINLNRFGVRQTADKSILLERNTQVQNLHFQLNKNEIRNKKILITGASGYLGQNLIKELYKAGTYSIIAFSRDKKRKHGDFKDLNLTYFDKKDLENGDFSLGETDVIIHCGFARPHCSYKEIADSLKFTSELFNNAVLHQVPAVINISSQSVYGLQTEPMWTENTPPAPETPYAQAKYAAELLIAQANKINKHTYFTSLRLVTLSGGQKGLIPTDFLSKFVLQAMKGEDIEILGGEQNFERLDVRDAAMAIKSLLQLPQEQWKSVYNLGNGEIYNIKDIAKMVVEISRKYTCKAESKIKIKEKNIKMNFGMENSRFCNDTGWRPKYNIKEIIHSLFKYFIDNGFTNVKKQGGSID